VGARALDPGLQAVHVDVNNRGSEEREHLAENEAADDGDAQRAAQFGADTRSERQGHAPRSAAMVVIRIGRKRNKQAL